MAEAIQEVEQAVPLKREDVPANRAYRKLLHEARAALAATDEAALSEGQWEALGDVLAGCVPDFGRHMQEKDRREVVKEVVMGIRKAQTALCDLEEGWKKAHEGAIRRRAEAKEGREILRTIILAWREEADERGARSQAKGGSGRRKGRGCLRLHTGHAPLPEAHTGMLESHECIYHSSITGELRIGKDPYDEKATFANKGEVAHLRGRKGKRESAVPAGTLARLFLTWMRLTGGPAFLRERRDRRNWEGQPPGAQELKQLERDRSKEGMTTGKDREWTGSGIGSRANTDTHQHTEKARRLFAEANASTHARGERVRRGNVEDEATGRQYRHRPPPRPNTGEREPAQEREAQEAEQPGDDEPTNPMDTVCMECDNEEECTEESMVYEGVQEADEDWEREMEIQTELEHEAANHAGAAHVVENRKQGE